MNNQKNLLIITLHADPSMPPGVGEWGGTHTYMRELLTELSDKTFNTILVTRKVFKSESDVEKISDKCKIIRLTLGKFGNFDKRELYNLHEETYKQIIEKLTIEKFKPNVIHSVYWNSGHIAMRLSREWNVPYVHSVISNGMGRNHHGATGTAEHRIETEKMVFKNARYIICVADSEKEEIHKYYDIDNDKILVAGQYVHPSFIYPPHNLDGIPRKSGINYTIEKEYYTDSIKQNGIVSNWWNQKVFTYTGRMSLDKGIQYIIKAWYVLYQKYKNACPPLWLIGGDTLDIEKIRPLLGLDMDILEQLEEEHRIVWWGYLDENGISAIYTRTLALITHSLYEPGGRVAVEAMCSGIPIIATPNGFALDAIKNWYNGFLVNYGDIDVLSTRMEHFIKQPYLSSIIGKNALNIGMQILSYWKFGETHIDAYNSAINNNKYIKASLSLQFTSLPNQRIVNCYPYNQILIDDIDIYNSLINMGITNITEIRQYKTAQSSSLMYFIVANKEKYIAKIPFDRIKRETLWHKNLLKNDLVTTSKKRYMAEIGTSSFLGVAPVINFDKNRCIILKKYYENIRRSTTDMIQNVIKKLRVFYSNDVDNFKNIFYTINNLIDQNTDIETIDQYYKEQSLKLYPWQNYFRDYSLRVEKIRWSEYYQNLSNCSKSNISKIVNICFETLDSILLSIRNQPQIVLIHGGCDIKNIIFTPEAILLDNEKVHVGWVGMDISDVLITLNRKHNNESVETWELLLGTISDDIIDEKILIGWIMLGTIKELVSMSALLEKVDVELLNERINSLKCILNKLNP